MAIHWCEITDIDGTPCAKERGHSDYHEAPGRRWAVLGPEVACAGCASLRAEVAQQQAQLAECYRLSGADPDGNEDWRLAPEAVEEVRQLRQDSDAEADRALALDKRVTRLERERDEARARGDYEQGRAEQLLADLHEESAESARLRGACEEAKELLRADAVENRILRSAFNVLTAALTPAPVERCETECDKGSRCTLPAEHGDRHETEHGCIAYDPRPTPAPVEGEGERRTPPPPPVMPLGSARMGSSVLACAVAPERDPSPFDPKASTHEPPESQGSCFVCGKAIPFGTAQMMFSDGRGAHMYCEQRALELIETEAVQKASET